MITPSSSSISRAAHARGDSPASHFPPGNMNRSVPALRTVATAPSGRVSTTADTEMMPPAGAVSE